MNERRLGGNASSRDLDATECTEEVLPRLAQSKQTHAPLIGDAIVAKQSSTLGSYPESSTLYNCSGQQPPAHISFQSGHFAMSGHVHKAYVPIHAKDFPMEHTEQVMRAKNRLSLCMTRKRVSAKSVEGGNEMQDHHSLSSSKHASIQLVIYFSGFSGALLPRGSTLRCRPDCTTISGSRPPKRAHAILHIPSLKHLQSTTMSLLLILWSMRPGAPTTFENWQMDLRPLPVVGLSWS